MATPLSIHNLLDGGWRTVLSIVGISIAIILIFMQLGFLGAVLDTAVVFYNNLKFDLVVRSPDYYHFCDSKNFSRRYLDQIKNVEGVEAIQPYHISLGKWNYEAESVQRGMLIMGVNPEGQTFASRTPDIKLPDTRLLVDETSILVDEKSRPQFLGFGNKERFSTANIGLPVELNQKRVEIAGVFRIGTGLAANGASVIHERGFQQLFPNHGPQDVSIGLIQLDPAVHTNAQSAQAYINQKLGFGKLPPVEVLTREDVNSREVRHWVTNTPVGFIFITGVVVAFIVGAIIVYIVLSSDITKQIGEYATLKAMGYRNAYMSRIVLEQALILGIISYIAAFLISLILYRVVGSAANLPITMTIDRQLVVFGSTIAMCCLSGAIAMQKLRRADPADLF